MISAKPLAAVVMLTLVGVASTQERLDAERVEELIAQAQLVENRGDRWFWNTPTDLLVRAGSSIVPDLERLLERAVKDGDEARIEVVLDVLTAMGPEAIEAWDVVTRLERTISEQQVPALYRTIAELAPYQHGFDSLAVHDLVRIGLTRLQDPESLALIQPSITRMEERTLKRKVIQSIDDVNEATLIRALQYGRGFEAGLAAELLARRQVVDVDLVMSKLHYVMRVREMSWFRAPREGQEETGGLARDRDLLRKATLAMLAIAPDHSYISTAYGMILYRHADPVRREAAAFRSTVPFLHRALYDEDQRVVLTAITVLGTLGAEVTVPTLERLEKHEDPQIAERAKAALRPVRQARAEKQLASELIQRLRDGGSEEEAERLARLGTVAVVPLLDAIESEAKAGEWDSVAWLFSILGRLELTGSHALPLLHFRASSALQGTGFPGEPIHVQRGSYSAIIRVPDRDESVRGLEELILSSPDAEATAEAVWNLADLEAAASTAVPTLIRAAKGSDQRLAEHAIAALGWIGPAAKEAIPTLERLAEHDDPQISERAKEALRGIRG